MTQGQIQLGKGGITENFIRTLGNHFKKNDNVRVNVLKSASHDKEKVREYSRKIIEKLGINYTAKVVGFTIFIKKWRKARR